MARPLYPLRWHPSRKRGLRRGHAEPIQGFGRLGAWCCRRRRRVVALWFLAALVAFGGLRVAGGGDFHGSNRLPQSESRRGFDLLGDDFVRQAGGVKVRLVIRPPYIRRPKV